LIFFSQFQDDKRESLIDSSDFQFKILLALETSAKHSATSPSLRSPILKFNLFSVTFSKHLISSKTEVPFPVPILKVS
jgi:hypothetical protein